jgi:hypothetical protein
LRKLKSELAEIKAQMRRLESPSIKTTVSDIRKYVSRSLVDLRSLFEGNVYRAKLELSKHVTKLVLTPKQTPEGPVYEVAGDWKLLPDKECVIWMVARDGVEPPTPAFSGLRSTT